MLTGPGDSDIDSIDVSAMTIRPREVTTSDKIQD